MSLPAWAVQAGERLDEAGRAELGQSAARGAGYLMLSSAMRFLGSFVGALVLARLLAPEDFGLMAMVAPLVALVTIFSDAGVSHHTLQRARVDEAEMSLTFWIGLAVATVAAIAFAVLAPVITWFYGDPRVQPIALAMAGIFVLNAFRLQHDALCRRCMRHDLYATAEVVDTVASILAGVVLAASGAGAWALVGMVMVRSVAHSVAIWWLTGWVPGVPRRCDAAGEILGFGGNVMLGQFVSHLTMSADKVLIGWWHGAVALGYYQLAFSLMMLPIQQVLSPIATVAVPYLSRLRDALPEMEAAVARVATAIGLITWPAMAVVAVVAEPLIVLVLGSKWAPAAPIFSLLAIASALYSARVIPVWVMLALGQARDSMLWSVICAGPVLAAFAIGLPWGGVGVATALVAVEFALGPAAYAFAARRTGVSFRPAARAIATPLFAAVLAGGGTVAVIATAAVETDLQRVIAGACVWVVVSALSFFAAVDASRRIELLRRVTGGGSDG